MPFSNVAIRNPFSKSTASKIWRQKICRFCVNGRPIRHVFHRFQNVPALRERSLSHVYQNWFSVQFNMACHIEYHRPESAPFRKIIYYERYDRDFKQ